GEEAEQRALAEMQPGLRFDDGEPLGAIDFGERLLAAGAGRPVHVEAVRAEGGGGESAFEGVGDEALGAGELRLSDESEGAGRHGTDFLGELAARGRLGAFAGIDEALGDGPSGLVLFRPERAARMDKKDLATGRAVAVEEDAGGGLS